MLTYNVARRSQTAREACEQVMELIESEVILGQGMAAGNSLVTATVTLAFVAVTKAKAAQFCGATTMCSASGRRVVHSVVEIIAENLKLCDVCTPLSGDLQANGFVLH